MKTLRPILRSTSGRLGGLLVLAFLAVALIGPLLVPHDPLRTDLRALFMPPGSPGHLLGTDDLGRDLLSRIVHGARLSLVIGLFAVGLGVVVGIPVGVVAGYTGGAVDRVTVWASDVFLSLPRILLAVLIAAVYGFGFWSVVFAIGFPDIPIFARLARAATLGVNNLDYVSAARAVGARHVRVMARHVLPNLLGPLVVQATFSLAIAVLTAGGLSFLGLGIQPPTPEWGSMLAQGRDYMRTAPHLVAFPGLALALTVLGANLLGDALQQVYDPRLRESRTP